MSYITPLRLKKEEKKMLVFESSFHNCNLTIELTKQLEIIFPWLSHNLKYLLPNKNHPDQNQYLVIVCDPQNQLDYLTYRSWAYPLD